jgi:nucleotide-binding universal stress UspA family protein
LIQIVAETMTEVGDPKEVIREAVEKLNIQLLVLGSHGRGAIKRLVAKNRHLSLH